MTINSINFKSSLLTHMQQARPVASNNPIVINEPIKQPNAKINTTTMIVGGSSLLLLVVAIIKRKSITTFFKKLLNKIPKEAQTTIQETTSDIEKQLEEKLKIIPKPNFSCTKESDPKLYKKECKQYVDSILKYTRHCDEDIQCRALELIGKYGFTDKHLTTLAGFAGTPPKFPKIIQAFVKAIADFGDESYSGYISEFIYKEHINKYDKETLSAIIKALERVGNNEQQIDILKNYLKHDSKDIQELAQKAISSIEIKCKKM